MHSEYQGSREIVEGALQACRLKDQQNLGYRTPAEVFMSVLVETTDEDLVGSSRPDTLTTEPLGTAGPSLNVASALPN